MDTERTMPGGRFIGPLKTKWHPDKLKKQKPSRALWAIQKNTVGAVFELVCRHDGVPVLFKTRNIASDYKRNAPDYPGRKRLWKIVGIDLYVRLPNAIQRTRKASNDERRCDRAERGRGEVTPGGAGT